MQWNGWEVMCFWVFLPFVLNVIICLVAGGQNSVLMLALSDNWFTQFQMQHSPLWTGSSWPRIPLLGKGESECPEVLGVKMKGPPTMKFKAVDKQPHHQLGWARPGVPWTGGLLQGEFGPLSKPVWFNELGEKNSVQGLPWGLSGEESCQHRRHRFSFRSRKIPHASKQLGLCIIVYWASALEPVLCNKRSHCNGKFLLCN